MTSQKKLDANTRNAQKSTGPKTLLGKWKVRSNAAKHGAFATKRLLRGESGVLYEEVRSEQEQRFKPKDYVATALVDELVYALWTLRRLSMAERYYFEEYRSEMDAGPNDSPLYALAQRFGSDGGAPPAAPKPASEKRREFYARAYIYDESGRIERIRSLRRSTLQMIVNLEKELQRRTEEQVEISLIANS